MITTPPSSITPHFGNARELVRRAHARGLQLADVAVLLALLDDHPHPIRMSRLLDLTSLARQTANHHLRCLARHVKMDRRPAIVGKRRMRPIAHYGLTEEGFALCRQLFRTLPSS